MTCQDPVTVMHPIAASVRYPAPFHILWCVPWFLARVLLQHAMPVVRKVYIKTMHGLSQHLQHEWPLPLRTPLTYVYVLCLTLHISHCFHNRLQVTPQRKNSPLRNLMEQSLSWEANSSSPSQDIPHILWNLNIHYRTHKHTLPVLTLSQIKQRKNNDCKIITFKTLFVKEIHLHQSMQEISFIFIHSFILFPYIPFRYTPWKWKTSHSIYITRQLAHGITSIAKVEKYL